MVVYDRLPQGVLPATLWANWCGAMCRPGQPRRTIWWWMNSSGRMDGRSNKACPGVSGCFPRFDVPVFQLFRCSSSCAAFSAFQRAGIWVAGGPAPTHPHQNTPVPTQLPKTSSFVLPSKIFEHLRAMFTAHVRAHHAHSAAVHKATGTDGRARMS